MKLICIYYLKIPPNPLIDMEEFLSLPFLGKEKDVGK